jgi:hypothetical protein
MTTRRLDFDSFRRERTGEPVVLAVGGIEYMLPPQLPAATALDIIALNRTAIPCAEHEPNVEAKCEECVSPDATPEQIFDMAEPLFGAGVLRKVAAANDLSVDELGDLIINVFQLYNEDQPSPNRQTRRMRAMTRDRKPGRRERTSG